MKTSRLKTWIQRHLSKSPMPSSSSSQITEAPTMSNPTANNKLPLSILCFGDSLTEGYSRYGTKFTPYSTSLLTHLVLAAQSSPILSAYTIKITTSGASGQLVTNGFQERMYQVLKTQRGKKEGKFDWVVFLGGTNDLGWGKPADVIWTGIEECTESALESGSRVLTMTIPECGVKSDRLDGKRNELNCLIKEDEREGVYVLDLWKGIPYHDMDEEERELIWDDGLHFTEDGYDRVGKLVAERLVEILEGEAKVKESSVAADKKAA